MWWRKRRRLEDLVSELTEAVQAAVGAMSDMVQRVNNYQEAQTKTIQGLSDQVQSLTNALTQAGNAEDDQAAIAALQQIAQQAQAVDPAAPVSGTTTDPLAGATAETAPAS